MTTRADEPRPANRLLMFLGHYATLIFIVFFALTVVEAAVPVVAIVDDVVCIAAMFSMWAEVNYHNARLCERCIAASPLDPQAAVVRWRPVLRWAHARWAKVFGLLLVLAWVFGENYLPAHTPGWVRATGFPAVIALLAAISVADWAHRRLYPWCPFCRWGDGGGEEISPDVPAPAVSR